MALTSSSTFAQILAEYKDTANYEANGSAAEARRFATSIRYLLIEMPNSSVKGSNQVGFSKGELERQLKQAEQYARTTGATQIKRAAFREMRALG